ncbi:50S ribosomal protein L35 [Blattabacterium sp. DPU]|uniref:50S ribosomal protein L35 n=1 Tax=Blattabacterium sp. DPU TaxID=2715232 RepID=UPI00140E59AC|nr:50S ribosomal protein L35 [Blattabacterium sp. DPU]QIK16808.1 50S ribosomal protein L35 [Blattabacterium sp. DPU]
MPKLKTKSGSKKRFKKTAHGYIKRKHAFKNHLLNKKSKRRKRNLSLFTLLKKSDQKNIKTQI